MPYKNSEKYKIYQAKYPKHNRCLGLANESKSLLNKMFKYLKEHENPKVRGTKTITFDRTKISKIK